MLNAVGGVNVSCGRFWMPNPAQDLPSRRDNGAYGQSSRWEQKGGTFTPLTGTILDGMRIDVRTLWLVFDEVYITAGLKGRAGGLQLEREPRKRGLKQRGRGIWDSDRLPVFGLLCRGGQARLFVLLTSSHRCRRRRRHSRIFRLRQRRNLGSKSSSCPGTLPKSVWWRLVDTCSILLYDERGRRCRSPRTASRCVRGLCV